MYDDVFYADRSPRPADSTVENHMPDMGDLLGTDLWGEGNLSWNLGALRRKLQAIVEDESIRLKVAFLCGEAGMGKTQACLSLLDHYIAKSAVTAYLSLADRTSAEAAGMLTRFVRKMGKERSAKSERAVVVIDDFPPTDECDLARQTRAIMRLTVLNCFVIVCLRPEASQIVEEFPQAIAIRSEDMLVRCSSEGDARLQRLTYGIPALVSAYDAMRRLGTTRSPMEALAPTLEPLVGDILRGGLPREEQCLRLAMMLLGSGTLDDVSSLLDKTSVEEFYWLARDAPFFGIDMASETFRCACLESTEGLKVCAHVLRDVMRRYTEVAYGCAFMLAMRGEYSRSAQIAILLEADVVREIVREWGIEYVCIGEFAFVKKVVTTGRWSRSSDLHEREVAAAVALLEAPVKSIEQDVVAPQESEESTTHSRRRRRHLELLRMCRDLDGGISLPAPPSQMRGDDELSLALISHIEARALILSGSATEAYQLLVNSPRKLQADSFVNALLVDDYELAEVLTGEEPDEREREVFAAARRFFEKMGAERLDSYRGVLEAALSVLVGRAHQIEDVERAISYATRMGDNAVAAAYLISAAVADNRAKLYARGHVRASQALTYASGQGEALPAAARLVDALSYFALGEDGPLRMVAHGRTEGPERVLASFFQPELSRAGQQRLRDFAQDDGLPSRSIWMLNMFCNDFGDASREFRRTIPRAWYALSRRAVRKGQHFWSTFQSLSSRPAGIAVSDVTGFINEPALPGLTIELSVLGEFSVVVNGTRIVPDAFDKRRAKCLLVYLAIMRGHKAARFSLVDAIWSESDYEAGAQRIYEATSAARTAIGIKRSEFDVFVGSRGEGTVGLNPLVFVVDVDRFERAAHMALLPGQSDEDVIDRVCTAIDLYHGNVCEMHFDAKGEIATRRQELADLYADIAVVGAQAALREGRASLATRIARQANELNDTREDVILVLIEALKASGRYLEARDAYARYARAVVERTGMPPSMSVRLAMRDVFPMLKRHSVRAEKKVAKASSAHDSDAARPERDDVLQTGDKSAPH